MTLDQASQLAAVFDRFGVAYTVLVVLILALWRAGRFLAPRVDGFVTETRAAATQTGERLDDLDEALQRVAKAAEKAGAEAKRAATAAEEAANLARLIYYAQTGTHAHTERTIPQGGPA